MPTRRIKPICFARYLGQCLGSLLLPDALDDTAGSPYDAVDWQPESLSNYCYRCGALAGVGAVTQTGCPHCRAFKLSWDCAYRLAIYKPPLSTWIVQMKFNGMWAWCHWFADQLISILPDESDALIVPIPLHWSRWLKRGYDQAALLAQAIAHEKNMTYAPLLKRIKRTNAQSLMKGYAHRRENVKDAFAMVNIDLTGKTIWLVDDMKTTGATAEQCCRLLKKAGAKKIELITIAVADPKGTDFQRK